ncbi:MAG: hypothetical protein AAF617_17155 [Bacteroidota bacterium]
MKLICQRCSPNEEFEIPHFSQEEKDSLHQKNKFSPLLAIQEIRNLYPVSLRDAKFIVHHINKQYAYCNRCQASLQEQEYTTCNKCNALNFNWKLS